MSGACLLRELRPAAGGPRAVGSYGRGVAAQGSSAGAAGLVAGGLALLPAAVLLLRWDAAVRWAAELNPLQLGGGAFLVLVAVGVVQVVVTICGTVAELVLRVHLTPRAPSPWLRTRVLAGSSAYPLAGLAVTAALAARLDRAEPRSFDEGALVAFVLGAAVVTGMFAQRTGRLFIGWLFRPAERLAAASASRERLEATRRMRSHLAEARDDLVAAESAALAAAAWDGLPEPAEAASVGAYLAGNEAETLLFGLDRLAYCCRPDGAVPLDPAARLAAAAALAEHAHALRPGDWFPAGALALVRLAQQRPTDARRLVRPHLEARRRPNADAVVIRAQLLALAAMTELAGDPARAIAQATAAWRLLPEDGRDDNPATATVTHVLAHVRRATQGRTDR